uniref:Uncharacterized protein n=1 Tax=Macrostomum lignano TaxID=282301 RepID=A0A1I8I2I3_9PLAT
MNALITWYCHGKKTRSIQPILVTNANGSSKSFLKEPVLVELIETGALWTWTRFEFFRFQNGLI